MVAFTKSSFLVIALWFLISSVETHHLNAWMRIHKRSIQRAECPVPFDMMCESCSKATRSTVIFYKCCRDHASTIAYCNELFIESLSE